MTYSQLRSWVESSAEGILDRLTQRQFVSPHRPVAEVLAQTLAELGAPEETGNAVMQRLSLDPQMAIGRLKRCQVTQLSRVIYRKWQHPGEQ